MDSRKDFTGARNLAHVTLTLNEDGKCGIHWKGTTIQLADILYTTMQHDGRLAAIICQAAKDFIETCKGDAEKWRRLTVDCADVQQELAHRYARKTIANKEDTARDAAAVRRRTQPQCD